MKLKNIVLVLALFVSLASSAFATQLPPDVKAFILKQNPSATIRFDGLIYYKDGTIYLPVVPSYLESVDDLKISYTYPAKKTFAQKPEVIIFNNNYSLLKLIKTNQGALTVCQYPDVPAIVKTGALPQDILVPKGLKFPDTLKGVLGNVEIPLISSNIVLKTPAKKKAPLPNAKNYANERLAVNSKLQNKLYFVTNYDSQYLKVFSSELADPLYSLKINGVPRDIKPISQGKYLLLTVNGKTTVDVIDIKQEQIAKEIDLGVQPSEIVVDSQGEKAYIASAPGKALFIIDLKSMTLKEKIKIVGSPEKIAISDDGSQIAYLDKDSCDVYIIKLDGTYANRLIANIPNTSKIIIKDDRFYSIIRTKQKLSAITYDLDKKFEEEELDASTSGKNEQTDILSGVVSGFNAMKPKPEAQLTKAPKTYATDEKDFEIGTKPTDMIVYKNKVFILCSQSNDIYVFDTNHQEITKVIKLPVSGFSRKLTQIDNSSVAIVTNVIENRYVVLDLEKEDSVQTIGINMPVNSITIIDRN